MREQEIQERLIHLSHKDIPSLAIRVIDALNENINEPILFLVTYADVLVCSFRVSHINSGGKHLIQIEDVIPDNFADMMIQLFIDREDGEIYPGGVYRIPAEGILDISRQA